jgi:hypothetical protein
VDRGIYSHHGIYVGNNQIVHFAPAGGGNLLATKSQATVLLQDFDYFLDNNTLDNVSIVTYKISYDLEVAARRAEKAASNPSIWKDKYNLLTTNCEHLATWCCTGVWKSEQVYIVHFNQLNNSFRLATL